MGKNGRTKNITKEEDLCGDPLEPSLTYPHSCHARNGRQVAAEQHQGGDRTVAETGEFRRGRPLGTTVVPPGIEYIVIFSKDRTN